MVGLLYGLGIGATAVVSLGIVALASRAVLLDDLRTYLGRTAETLAAGVDGSRLDLFRDSAQTHTSAYDEAARPLRSLLAANPDIRFAYVGRIRADSMFYVLDGATDNPAFVMEPDAPTAGELELWRTGTTVIERQPTPTAWGEGIRAYAPIRDRQARLVGYVGVTMSAENYRRWVHRVTRTALLGLGVAGLLATLGAVAAARTDAARLAAETAMRRAKDIADQATRSKSQFLANMSHEIRTPMNGVMGFAELLSRTDLDDKQRLYVDTVRRSAESLIVVVNDILDFSKIEAGRLAIEQARFALPALAADLVSLFLPQARAKGLTLSAHCAADLGAPVIGDPLRVRQILVNLVGNAVKFTERGSVRVVVRRDGPILVRFEVVDTGIGLVPAQTETIFAEFTQADGSTSRRFGGTGLGLAICRRLVELMGGQIGVASELGRGSTFWFELPLAPAEAEAALPRPQPTPVDAATS